MAIPEAITSRDNRRLVNARKVRDGDIRELIFIEGKRLAAEALSAGLIIDECLVGESFAESSLVARISSKAPVFTVPDKLFRTMVDTTNPQGIVVLAQRPKAGFLHRDDLPLDASPFVFLKDVNNPSNLGAILRTAEAAGAGGVITSPNSADAFSPKSLRAAMGSAFRMGIEQGISLLKAVEWARSRGIRVVGTDPENGVDHAANNWTIPTLVIFGSEAHGLTSEELAMCDSSVRIAIVDGVESLNLAASAAVILFEARRQLSA
ncbi:MAG: RNA methyltransferase [Pyrinomonadaceae bacterium]